MPEWAKLLVPAVAAIATAVVAIRDAYRPAGGDEDTAEAAGSVVTVAPAPREWLLDSVPVEEPVDRRERAASAGRLAIGITGIAIVGAAAVLGISRAFSAVFDRLLR